MRYELRLTAYDCMNFVQVAATVTMTEDTPGSAVRKVLHVSTTVLGTGENDPAEWARDALVSALEAL